MCHSPAVYTQNLLIEKLMIRKACNILTNKTETLIL